MPKLEDKTELREKRFYAAQSLKRMVEKAQEEGRTLSEDEEKSGSAWKKEIREYDDQLDAIERNEELVTSMLEASTRALTKIGRKTDPSTIEDRARPVIETSQYRCGELHAFTSERFGSRKAAEDAAYSTGMWLRAVLAGNVRARQWCQERGLEARFNSETVNTSGGAPVPDLMATTIIDLREKYGVLRRYADVWPMQGDTLTIPREVGDLTVYLVGEGVAITESNATFDGLKLVAQKWGVLSTYSTELAEDAILNLADKLTQKIGYAFAKEEDRIGFMGTGTNADKKLTGLFKLITANGSGYKAWVDPASGVDTFAEITAANLSSLMGAVADYALDGAAFFCSSVCKASVFDRLKIAVGGATVRDVEGKMVDTYLGYPIVTSQVLENSTGTINNTPMIGFGNLKQCISLGDRRGIAISTSPDYKFDQDLLAIKGTQRIAMAIHDIGDTSSYGSFACLMGNT